MKVLLVTTDMDRPEAAMLAGLARAGVDVTAIVSDKAVNLDLPAAAGIELMQHPYEGHRDSRLRSHLGQLIGAGQFDIIHVLRREALSNVLAVTGADAPPIIAYRGVCDRGNPLNPLDWRGFLHPRVRKVICVSDAVRRYFLRQAGAQWFYPANRYVTIHKGHDLEWYRYEGREDELRRIGIPEGQPVIALAAAMRRRKGVDLLIRAFDQVCQRHAAHLVLVGDVRDKRVLSAYRRARNRSAIHLLGHVDNAPALVGAADIMALPVRRPEGLPRAVIEAMAQGVPPIVTDMPGCVDLVTHNKTGLVVPSGDVGRLSQAIDSLLGDSLLRQRLGNAARECIAAHFTVERTVAGTLAVYQETSGPVH